MEFDNVDRTTSHVGKEQRGRGEKSAKTRWMDKEHGCRITPRQTMWREARRCQIGDEMKREWQQGRCAMLERWGLGAPRKVTRRTLVENTTTALHLGRRTNAACAVAGDLALLQLRAAGNAHGTAAVDIRLQAVLDLVDARHSNRCTQARARDSC